jgi:hypothetical protein
MCAGVREIDKITSIINESIRDGRKAPNEG